MADAMPATLYATNIVAYLMARSWGRRGLHYRHGQTKSSAALTVTDEGEITWPPPKPPKPPAPIRPKPKPVAQEEPDARGAAEPAPPVQASGGQSRARSADGCCRHGPAGLWLRFGVGTRHEPEMFLFLQHLTVFVLACFVGWQVIWNVTAFALHTPLMSVTNAISGIIIRRRPDVSTGTGRPPRRRSRFSARCGQSSWPRSISLAGSWLRSACSAMFQK